MIPSVYPLLGCEHRSMINKNTNSWAWYKAWIDALLYPNEDTWSILLSEGNISLRRAYIWITITSILFPLASSITTWTKFPLSITSGNIWIYIKNILLIGVLEPAGYIAITGAIHILAKLFFDKGNYQDFFVLFATSHAPISLLYTFTALVRWFFAFKIGIYAGALLNIYFIAVVSTKIIKYNYHANWIGAFLINVVVITLGYLLAFGIYFATGFGI